MGLKMKLKTLNKKASKIFRELIAKQKNDYVKVDMDSDSLMPLVLERIARDIPFGDETYDEYSLAHYGKQNGDMMRDPEQIFMVNSKEIIPYSFRNDYVGVNKYSITWSDMGPIVNHSAQKEDTDFANDWLTNAVSEWMEEGEYKYI